MNMTSDPSSITAEQMSTFTGQLEGVFDYCLQDKRVSKQANKLHLYIYNGLIRMDLDPIYLPG